jgi:tetratricopeptide (TPR) repeat protein
LLSFIIHHSSFIIHHSSFIIHHSSFIIHHSSFIIRSSFGEDEEAADPDFGNPYNDIGSYLIALGKHREAIPWLQRAIRAPRYQPRQFPHCNLGVLYEELGDFDRALRHYKEALRIDPRHPTARARRRRLASLLN